MVRFRGTTAAGRRSRLRRAVASVVGGAVLAPLLSVVPAAAAPGDPVAVPPGFAVSAAITGLNQPAATRIAPDGRVFVAEKSGVVKVFNGLDDPTPDVLVDLSANVHDFWDRGLLGLAVDPAFPARPYVYLLSTLDRGDRWGDSCPTPPGASQDGCVVDGRLTRVEVGPANQLVGSERILLEDRWCTQYPSHTVGSLAFGGDGALYLSAGDGADFNRIDYGQGGGSPGSPVPLNPCGDPGQVGGQMEPPLAEGGALRSQDLLTPGDPLGYGGTVLRLDPDTGAALPDNPLIGDPQAGADRVVALGLRNPFRMTARPGTDEVWVGDVGWSWHEEINRIADPTDAVIENFGWPCFEGNERQRSYEAAGLNLCQGIYDGTLPTDLVAPTYTYAHGAPPDPSRCGGGNGASVSGLAFYPGGDYPARYDGALFFADYTRGCIWSMELGADGNPDPATVSTFVDDGNAVDLTVSAEGELLFTDLLAGVVYRVEYFGSNTPPIAAATANPSSGPLPLGVTFDASGSSDPEGGALTYAWDLDADGEFDDSTAVAPTYTYTQAGPRSARLRVTDPGGAIGTAEVALQPGNSRPEAVITSPASTLRWKVGDPITFSGSASDPDQGTLPASALTWQVTINHCSSSTDCHQHPLQRFVGVASGTFDAPDHEYPSYVTIDLSVTDAGGLSDTETLRLDPATVQLTFESEPSGLRLAVGSGDDVTPFTREVIIGSNNSIGAPSPQTGAGGTWTFSGWSDGGERSHEIVAPATAATYRATFVPGGGLEGSPFVSDVAWVSEVNGFGPAERDTSNGEDQARDGRPLSVGGVAFAKGVGVHAGSDVRVDLGGRCSALRATVGVDDEVGANGSVVFRVLGDGVVLFDSGVVTGAGAGVPVNVDVTGVSVLALVVVDGGDNPWFDHADWAGAQLTCGTTPPPPPPGPSGTPWVSDLAFVSESNGWGPAERDLSNGENQPGDGRPLSVGGVAFAKGVGVHAGSDVRVDLSGRCSALRATVGLDDEVGANGSVVFRVLGDGVVLFDSGVVTGTSAGVPIDVPLAGVDTLALVVVDGGDNPWFDHADWAGAQLTCGTTPPPPPPPGGGLEGSPFVSDVTWVSEVNGFGPAERDTSNGEDQARDGRPLSVGGVSFAKGVGVHAGSDVRVDLNGRCSALRATVGVDDEVGANGSVVFRVLGDGVVLFDSGVVTGTSAGVPIDVPLAGVDTLALVVVDGGDNPWFDHADWAGAQLTCDTTTPPPPSGNRPPTATNPGGQASLEGDVVQLQVSATDPDAGQTLRFGAVGLPAGLQIDPATGVIAGTVASGAAASSPYQVTITATDNGTPARQGSATFTWTVADPDASFAPAVSFVAGANAHSVTTADLDGDGDQDVVAAAPGDNAVAVLAGDGQGGFGSPTRYPTGQFPKFAMAADVNGDGRADLVTANQDSTVGEDVSVLLGTGGGLFAPARSFGACSRPHEVAVGRFDADAAPDLAVACWGGDVVSILRGRGDGTFAAPVNYLSGPNPHSLVVADFNGDGRQDLGVANLGGGNAGVHLGRGDGTFAPVVTYSVGSSPHNIKVADLDGDGALDLVTANEGANSVTVLRGRGDGTFHAGVAFAAGAVPKAVAVGDLNGDGRADLVTANTHGNYPNGTTPTDVTVLYGLGGGQFGPPESHAAGLTPFSVAVADVTGDGRADILTANWHSGDVDLLRNRHGA